MKWIYVLTALIAVSLGSGCIDNKQDEIPAETRTSVSPGEAAPTPGAVIIPATSAAQAPEDVFGTDGNLSAIDTAFNDMNTEISLLDTI